MLELKADGEEENSDNAVIDPQDQGLNQLKGAEDQASLSIEPVTIIHRVGGVHIGQSDDGKEQHDDAGGGIMIGQLSELIADTVLHDKTLKNI